jgi:opacity protein-like surface antigen
MRKFVAYSAATIALSSAAMAADLPQRVVAPVVAVPAFTWAGVYAGVNAGAAWRDDDDESFSVRHEGSYRREEIDRLIPFSGGVGKSPQDLFEFFAFPSKELEDAAAGQNRALVLNDGPFRLRSRDRDSHSRVAPNSG